MENKVSTLNINKKDLRRLFIRSNAIQSAFNFERMQGLGWLYALLPLINKLYPEKNEKVQALKRHSGYFNTHPWLGGFIFGTVASMEERKANGDDVAEESIQAVKGSLMGPLAGMGDSVFFGTYRPIIAGICAAMALSGSWLAPILFVLLINIVHFGVQWYGVSKGYSATDKFLSALGSDTVRQWMEALTILGLLVVGALVATSLGIKTPLQYTNGDAVVAVQSMLDSILPKLLPLGVTLGIFGLVKKGKSATTVMLILIVVGFVLGFFGIL